MPPLDALTQARIRALEISLAWLIEQSFFEHAPEFTEAAMKPNYIMELAEKIAPEEEDD